MSTVTLLSNFVAPDPDGSKRHYHKGETYDVDEATAAQMALAGAIDVEELPGAWTSAVDPIADPVSDPDQES